MSYNIEISGVDSNGSYLVADEGGTLAPGIVANVGQGTSVALPSSGKYMLFVNQKGLYGSTTNGASSQTATRVTTYNNTAYFWYCDDWITVVRDMGTSTIESTWSNTADCRYILLASADALTPPSNQDYGISIDDENSNILFDSRLFTINDTFRILGEFTYDTPYNDNSTYASYLVDSDADVYVEMSMFTEPKTSASASPDVRHCIGPEFKTGGVYYGYSVPTQQYGKMWGSFPFGKLLYNPTNITAGKPTGWTQPY